MKTILLPTDFQKHSEKALELAIELAQKANAKIVVAHSFFISTMDANIPVSMLQEMYKEEREFSEKELIQYCHKIAVHKGENGKYLETEFVTEQNLAYQEIVKLVRQKNIDLIVMGTEGEDQLLGLLTSTTIDVLNDVKCPVLVVHENTTVKPLEKIYIAVENTRDDLLSLKQVIPVARLFNSGISLLHVDKFPENIEEIGQHAEEKEESDILLSGIKEQYNYSNIQFHYEIGKDTVQKIDHVLSSDKPDLLALVHKKRNWIEKLFHKSVIKHMIKSQTLPLMIIH